MYYCMITEAMVYRSKGQVSPKRNHSEIGSRNSLEKFLEISRNVPSFRSRTSRSSIISEILEIDLWSSSSLSSSDVSEPAIEGRCCRGPARGELVGEARREPADLPLRRGGGGENLKKIFFFLICIHNHNCCDTLLFIQVIIG